MKETQEILRQMGFTCSGKHNNLWTSEWFGSMLLHEDATPEQLAQFIYQRGRSDEASNPAFNQYIERVYSDIDQSSFIGTSVSQPIKCQSCGQYPTTVIATPEGYYCNECLPPNRN